MSFGDVSTAAGLAKLNEHLKHHSYVQGYEPSSVDATTFEAVKSVPNETHAYALRWYNHIKSFGDLRKKFGTASGAAQAPAANGAAAADDDDVDLFASDDEEASAEAEALKQKRVAEYTAKKAKKPAVIAKSNVILDVKPWDDETNMKDLENAVRSIEMDGLLWGTSKLVPVGYGINKLQINTVVEDDKVSIDELQEKIEAFEDFVQSSDVVAFNKI